jgi:hypothetical protein
MPRDAKPLLAPDPVTHPPEQATLPKEPSAIHKAPLALVDPYSQQMFAYTRPDHVATIQDLRPTPDVTGRASKLQRLLQLALLSSVAVLIWFMLSILQTTQ